MFRCHVCGSVKGQNRSVHEIFEIEGKLVQVEDIPATVCDNCGEITFSRETTEHVRQMVRERGSTCSGEYRLKFSHTDKWPINLKYFLCRTIINISPYLRTR